MNKLDQLNMILEGVRSHLALLGFTIGALMIVFYAIGIMLTAHRSVIGHAGRWDKLYVVIAAASLIAVSLTLLQTATGIFAPLNGSLPPMPTPISA